MASEAKERNFSCSYIFMNLILNEIVTHEIVAARMVGAELEQLQGTQRNRHANAKPFARPTPDCDPREREGIF